MIRTPRTVAVLLAGCCVVGAAQAETPAWVVASNRAAEKLLDVQAKYQPESVSVLGVERYDADIFDIRPRTVQRQEADYEAVAAYYEQAVAAERDPQVRQDLEILLKAARDQRTTTELQDRLLLPYFDLPQALFNGFRQRLAARAEAASSVSDAGGEEKPMPYPKAPEVLTHE